MPTNDVRVFSLTLLSIDSNQQSFFLSENRCHSHWQHTGAVPGLPLSSCKDNTFSRNLQTFLPLLRVLLQIPQTFSQKNKKNQTHTKPRPQDAPRARAARRAVAEPPTSHHPAPKTTPATPPRPPETRQKPHKKPTNKTSKPNKRDAPNHQARRHKPSSATPQTIKRDTREPSKSLKSATANTKTKIAVPTDIFPLFFLQIREFLINFAIRKNQNVNKGRTERQQGKNRTTTMRKTNRQNPTTDAARQHRKARPTAPPTAADKASTATDKASTSTDKASSNRHESLLLGETRMESRFSASAAIDGNAKNRGGISVSPNRTKTLLLGETRKNGQKRQKSPKTLTLAR